MGYTINYKSIKDTATKLGNEDKVRERAIQLQKELREPGCIIPYVDAYEMAYNEILSMGSYY